MHGNNHCLERVCLRVCVYMWLSVFEELLLRCRANAARQQTDPDTAAVRSGPQPGQVATHRWGAQGYRANGHVDLHPRVKMAKYH